MFMSFCCAFCVSEHAVLFEYSWSSPLVFKFINVFMSSALCVFTLHCKFTILPC